MLLDYGSGNVHSAAKALERAGADVRVTADRAAALEADGLVVPGVGAFRAVMDQLRAVRGDEIIDRRLAGGRPVLGICVGMQVLFERGVERGDDTEGLGEWPGVVTELPAEVLPHMGWNTVRPDEGSVLFDGIEDERFYFVHSFAAQEWLLDVMPPFPQSEADLGGARRPVPRRRRERTAVGDAVPPREVVGCRHPTARQLAGLARLNERRHAPTARRRARLGCCDCAAVVSHSHRYEDSDE